MTSPGSDTSDLTDTFEAMLSVGARNSLGRTEEVVAIIQHRPQDMGALFDAYQSDDEWVRMRVSSAFKRLAKSMPEDTATFVPQFIALSRTLTQPSFQWSFAQIMMWLDDRIDAATRDQIIEIEQSNLVESDDWIVLNNTMESLMFYATSRPDLATWLAPQLRRIADDPRKSVHNRAVKYLRELRG